MRFDAKNPPVWLRKLHVSAVQVSPRNYAAGPEEGIRLCCSLSDNVHAWSVACARALVHSPISPAPPLDHPFDPERRGIRNVIH
jgi:hypothetical protein